MDKEDNMILHSVTLVRMLTVDGGAAVERGFSNVSRLFLASNGALLRMG